MIFNLGNLSKHNHKKVGSKALNLDLLAKEGYRIPPGIVVSTDAYRIFTEKNGIKEKLSLLLHKKDLTAMRWEELWDLALSIESLFLRAEVPELLLEKILASFHTMGEGPKAVRSSSTLEDMKESSFAGLHNSYVNVSGVASVLRAMKQVWASLWTDRSLMYRRELGLSTEKDSMAVIIEEFIPGEYSGVVFTQAPLAPESCMIETVSGWNDALVSGRKEPERHTIHRGSGDIEGPSGAPEKLLLEVYSTAMEIEASAGSPQDVEWTFGEGELYILQTRPITTIDENRPTPSVIELYRETDKRKWSLSLRPSFHELLTMRKRIRDDIIPGMEEEIASLSKMDLAGLNVPDLDAEIYRRKEIFDRYEGLYWEVFIPFGHAFRLLGEVYNRTIVPDSPFEFIDLLGRNDLLSLERNALLAGLVETIQENPDAAGYLGAKEWEKLPTNFMPRIYELLESLGSSVLDDERLFKNPGELIAYLLKLGMSMKETRFHRSVDRKEKSDLLAERFLKAMEPNPIDGELLLDLARESYSLRDNDNLYLGRIKSEYLRAREEKEGRVPGNRDMTETATEPVSSNSGGGSDGFSVFHRQLIGTPAVAGIGRGPARLIRNQEDILSFKPGEIIVCRAVDPGITFIVPLAAAIIEKRGGMLIHGAIIAREYGIPCVTGVEDADNLLENGDPVLVDGYLGIITITNQRTSR
jgi:rifampicin phosphotransferase